MPISVFLASEIDPLVESLVHALTQTALGPKSPLSDLLTPKRVLVPNPNLAKFLKFEVATRSGIGSQLQFEYLDSFLGRQIERTRPGTSVGTRQQWASLLAEILIRDQLPAEVVQYLTTDPADEQSRGRKVFELSRELAQLFESYSLARPHWLEAWQHGESIADDEPTAAVESWQRSIWRLLFAPAALRDATEIEIGKKLLGWHEVPTFLDENSLALSHTLRLFGFSYLSKTHLEVLRTLGKRSAVEVYMFMPVRSDGASESQPIHPMYRQWAKPGLEFLSQMQEHSDIKVTHLPANVARLPSSTLTRLQGELSTRTFSEEAAPFVIDGSIRLFPCTDIAREAETVVDEIWRILQRSSSADAPLGLHEIAIVIADDSNLSAYQLHLRSAFEERHSLPVQMNDLSARQAASVVSAISEFFELANGEFSREQLGRFLTHPLVLPKELADAPEIFWRYVENAGIRSGLDYSDWRDTDVTQNLYSWDQGLYRLALGTMVDSKPFATADSKEVLPGDVPLSPDPSFDAFLSKARQLVLDLSFARSHRAPLRDWSRFFQAIIRSYLVPRDDNDSAWVRTLTKEFESLASADVRGLPLSFSEALAWGRQSLGGLAAQRGTYPFDGIVVSSFREMRPIPFRVIFLMGMGAGRFPRTSRLLSFDLRHRQSELGDVWAEDRDRYLFLETIGSARDEIIFSYVCRDAQTGERFEPSPVIRELQQLLGVKSGPSNPFGGEDKIPAKRYDVVTESENSRQFAGFSVSASKEFLAHELGKEIRADVDVPASDLSKLLIAHRPLLARWLGLEPLNESQTQASTSAERDRWNLSISSLRKFLECPLQGWARTVLGLREQPDDFAHQSEEPIELDRLGSSNLLQDVFQASLADPAFFESNFEIDSRYLELLREPAKQLELSGRFPSGFYFELELGRLAGQLVRWREGLLQFLSTAEGAPTLSDLSRKLPTDPHRTGLVFETIANSVAKRQVIDLVGPVELFSQRASQILVLTRNKGKPKDRYKLRGFLTAIALQAMGVEPAPQEILILARDPKESVRIPLPEISKEDSVSFLGHLLEDLFTKEHSYFFPIELASMFFDGRPLSELKSARDELLKDEKNTLESRFGPIPRPERFPLPTADQAGSILDRRFGLYIKMLTAKKSDDSAAKVAKRKRPSK